MNSSAPLTGTHLRTFNALFQHPVARNLSWHDVHGLFRHLGDFTEEANGNFKMVRNGQSMVLHAPRTKEVAEADEIVGLRHFLERSETPAAEAGDRQTHWLLVINHRQARVFRSVLRGASSEQVLPHDPDDYFRHAHNSKDFSRGEEKPEPNSYFEPVARALHSSGDVVVFGSGTGLSSEMDQFVAWTKIHHPELAKRIVGAVVVDEHHVTDDQLLSAARAFYATKQSTQP